jgi:hypothetical protein
LKKSLAEIDLVYEINGWNQQLPWALTPSIATPPNIGHEKLETPPAQSDYAGRRTWKTPDEIFATGR